MSESLLSNQKLLPCPFCGGEAVIEEVRRDPSFDEIRWSVGCTDSEGKVKTDGYACVGYMSVMTYPRKKDAIEAWNMRAVTGETREAQHEVTAACVENDCPCQRPRCDRAEILVQRAINCGWIQCLGENGRYQLQTTARIALDAEVEAGGPYLTPASPTLVWQCCDVWYGPARAACHICKKPRPALKTGSAHVEKQDPLT